MAFLTHQPLDLAALVAAVSAPNRGGACAFLGAVRDHHAGRAVLELEDIQPVGDTVVVSYRTGEGPVHVVFSFNADGKIARTHCGPAAMAKYA